MNCQELYEQEKKRADDLQAELDEADVIHFDELADLIKTIRSLQTKLTMRSKH